MWAGVEEEDEVVRRVEVRAMGVPVGRLGGGGAEGVPEGAGRN